MKIKQDQKKTGQQVEKKIVILKQPSPKFKEVRLFDHLYVRKPSSILLNSSEIHPAIICLGVQYKSRVIMGSNARCVALLSSLKKMISDYVTPPEKEFSRGLEASLNPSIAYLESCRPLSVSMINAVKHIKLQLTQLPNAVSDAVAKCKLNEAIDTYIRDQIEVAAQAICDTTQRKIADGDCILTYGCSSVILKIFLEAHQRGKKFKVIVVDGRPWREGKKLLRRLVVNGVQCSYVLLTGASFIMREVTKVFLGAHALLANGYVMSRAGSSQIALLASSFNIPVLVCCETHKFCERVQTDSIVYNELGDPDELFKSECNTLLSPARKWKNISNLIPLNLTYDVTPPDFVTAVVTELAILPCTSVPVVLRVKTAEGETHIS